MDPWKKFAIVEAITVSVFIPAIIIPIYRGIWKRWSAWKLRRDGACVMEELTFVEGAKVLAEQWRKSAESLVVERSRLLKELSEANARLDQWARLLANGELVRADRLAKAGVGFVED